MNRLVRAVLLDETQQAPAAADRGLERDPGGDDAVGLGRGLRGGPARRRRALEVVAEQRRHSRRVLDGRDVPGEGDQVAPVALGGEHARRAVDVAGGERPAERREPRLGACGRGVDALLLGGRRRSSVSVMCPPRWARPCGAHGCGRAHTQHGSADVEEGFATGCSRRLRTVVPITAASYAGRREGGRSASGSRCHAERTDERGATRHGPRSARPLAAPRARRLHGRGLDAARGAAPVVVPVLAAGARPRAGPQPHQPPRAAAPRRARAPPPGDTVVAGGRRGPRGAHERRRRLVVHRRRHRHRRHDPVA